MYDEDDFLQLSGIQHFAFCRRQWALAYIELQWQENVRTVEGKLLHNRAHEASSFEKRGDILISRGMPVQSRIMGVSGECDVVEFHRQDTGINLHGREGKYQVIPIEYKRGSPKVTDVDMLQLSAQAMCLEEMLCCTIPFGYLYYGETKHRKQIDISEELRRKTKEMFREMHQYYERRYTPKVRWSKSCNACSLKDICLPGLGRNKSVANYINNKMTEEE